LLLLCGPIYTQPNTKPLKCLKNNRAVLTASADVDVQVAFDNSAAFEGLSGIHGVDDLLLAHFITHTIAGFTEHTGDGKEER